MDWVAGHQIQRHIRDAPNGFLLEGRGFELQPGHNVCKIRWECVLDRADLPNHNWLIQIKRISEIGISMIAPLESVC